jgi:hypothetical protein
VKRGLSWKSSAIAQKDIDSVGSGAGCERSELSLNFAAPLHIADALLPSSCLRVFEFCEVQAITAKARAFRARQLEPYVVAEGRDRIPSGSAPAPDLDKRNEMFSGKARGRESNGVVVGTDKQEIRCGQFPKRPQRRKELRQCAYAQVRKGRSQSPLSPFHFYPLAAGTGEPNPGSIMGLDTIAID